MSSHTDRIGSLETQISTLESQLIGLRNELLLAQAQRDGATPSSSHEIQMHDAAFLHATSNTLEDRYLDIATAGGFSDAYQFEVMSALGQPVTEKPNQWPLGKNEYKRYGRQLIMQEMGLPGQLKLKAAKVLIVGVGGLGCPAAAYLAGAGVGTLGLVDGDEVEESNLHRQILHSSNTIGWSKVDSAIDALRNLNPLVHYNPHKGHLTSQNALQVVSEYDVVLDCTDTPASRYLISDSCVLLQKPLISASALRTEGQLMLLNHPTKPAGDLSGGPCYRCVFPKPPPAESVISCGDGGILGPVVGTMGVLQALETIKVIITNCIAKDLSPDYATYDEALQFEGTSAPKPTMLLFSAYSSPQFRSIKLRSRSPKCAACSSNATVTQQAMCSGSMDYIQFCGVTNQTSLLSPSERISAQQYADARRDISLSGRLHRVIDVRETVQFDLCHLFGSINIPFSRLTTGHDAPELMAELRSSLKGDSQSEGSTGGGDPILVVCRLGNDSQVAVRKLKELGFDDGGKTWIGDVRGGLKAWRQDVDPTFPDY